MLYGNQHQQLTLSDSLIADIAYENNTHSDSTFCKDYLNGRPDNAVHVSANMAERARYLAKLTTDEYKQLTRKRNAVEGIQGWCV